jgi:hypothetical protein
MVLVFVDVVVEFREGVRVRFVFVVTGFLIDSGTGSSVMFPTCTS